MDENGNVDEHKGNGGGKPVGLPSDWNDKYKVADHGKEPVGVRIDNTEGINGNAALDDVVNSTGRFVVNDEDFQRGREILKQHGILLGNLESAFNEVKGVEEAITSQNFKSYYTSFENTFIAIASIFEEKKEKAEHFVNARVEKDIGERVYRKVKQATDLYQQQYEQCAKKIQEFTAHALEREELSITLRKSVIEYRAKVAELKDAVAQLELDINEAEGKGDYGKAHIYRKNKSSTETNLNTYSFEGMQVVSKFNSELNKVTAYRNAGQSLNALMQGIGVRYASLNDCCDRLKTAGDLQPFSLDSITLFLNASPVTILQDGLAVANALYGRFEKTVEATSKGISDLPKTPMYEIKQCSTGVSACETFEKMANEALTFKK